MAAPSIQSSSIDDANNGTSPTITMPTGVTAGDLLIAFFSINNASGSTITPPAGWTSLSDNTNGQLRFAVFYKTATGSEGATQTVTLIASSASSSICYRISGWSGTPEISIAATGTSTAPDPTAIAPSWGGVDTLYLAVASGRRAGGFVLTNGPTGYANAVISQNSGSVTNRTCVVTLDKTATSASEDPSAFTLTSSAWIAQVVAISPTSTAATLTADTGTFTETGVAVVLAAKMAAVGRAFTETGLAALFKISFLDTTGVFTETGQGVVFKTSFLAAGTSYVLIGLAAQRKMPVITGVFTETGLPVIFKLRFVASVGAYTETAPAVPLVTKLVSTHGTFTLTGQPVLFPTRWVASTGVFVETTNAAPFVTKMNFEGPGLFFIHWGSATGVIIRGEIKDGYRRMRVRTGQHTFSTREARKW